MNTAEGEWRCPLGKVVYGLVASASGKLPHFVSGDANARWRKGKCRSIAPLHALMVDHGLLSLASSFGSAFHESARVAASGARPHTKCLFLQDAVWGDRVLGRCARVRSENVLR